jgi:WD repeat-containing protein 89
MASAATDGLVNIFDISQASEDDAFLYCLNTESSAAIINWHKQTNGKDSISCITHTHDLHLYDVEEQDLIVAFTRDKITESVKVAINKLQKLQRIILIFFFAEKICC